MTGILDELQQGIEEVRKANLPKFDERLRILEIKLKDLEERLKPLLAILRVR
jgi:hypothetical protein